MKSKRLQKQQLGDLERRINMDLGDYLVLIEEGSTSQIKQAKQRARNDLIKMGPDMIKLAYEVGGDFPTMVDSFLDNVDEILHVNMIDDAQISDCYRAAHKLEKELKSK